MMLALLGQPSSTDAFAFFLAEKLGMTVAQLQDMGNDEYMGWQSYFKAKHAIQNQKEVS